MDYCAFHDAAHIKNHGASTYTNHKCRCSSCRAGNANAQMDWRQRVAQDVPKHVHGSENGYTNYRCRCKPCTQAHTEACRTKRIAR